MHTRLSQLADKTIEAAVLAAALAIPLFFNPYSARVFESEQVSLLRALGAITATAGLVRFLESRAAGWRSFARSFLDQPVILAALLIGAVTVIASLTSITPRLSLWGSYQRGQGIITTLGYLVLFFGTVSTFNNPDRRRRLVTTLLVASGPVALLAVVQFAGLNPVPLRSLEPWRVFGTLSNPIFLGAYLVLVIPLALAQIVCYGFANWGVRGAGGMISYVVLLALQVAAALFSGSRGPLLGLAAGVLLLMFLLALRSRRRGVAGGLLAVAALGLALLVLFNLPNTPLASLRDIPIVGRFGEVVGGSGQVRVFIWQSVVDRFAGDPSTSSGQAPSTGLRAGPARLVLGYGPESTHAALLRTYHPELRRLESERLPDRAHNVFLEALVTTGLLGAASVAFLFAALFYTGLRALGWVSTSRERNQWLALTAAGLVLGVLVPWWVTRSETGHSGWAFAGFGAAVGLVAGLGAHLVLCLWRSEPEEGTALTDRSVLIAGILAALAGHLIEISVGIRVTATESVFWILAGLLVGLSNSVVTPFRPGSGQASVVPEVAEAATTKGARPHRSNGITLLWDPEPAALGLLGGLMLSTLAFGLFLLPGAGISVSAVGRWVTLIGAWGLAGMLWLWPPAPLTPQILGERGAPGTGWIYPLVSAAWAGLFIALRSSVPILGGDALTLVNLYFVWLLLSLAAIVGVLPQVAQSEAGHSLSQGERSSPLPVSRWVALVYPVLGAVALGLVAWLAVKPLYADIYLEAAQAYAGAGQWSQALAFYQKAAAESPDVDVYQQHLGEAFVTAARLTQDPSQRDALFGAGEQAFRRAVALNPAEGTHHFNLAHLHLLWAQATTDPARQATLLNQAAILYEQAAAQTPRDPRLLTEWGLVLEVQGDADAALAKYRAALEMDPRDTQAYLQIGNLYRRSGMPEQALQMYQQAIEVEPDRGEAYRALADVYRQQGRLTDAVAAQQRAAELRPTDYTIHQNLALLYRDLGQIDNAVAEARLALSYAPPEQQTALQSFIRSLLGSSPP